ncbi:MAG TPA: DUF4337 family protein [Gemmataceae bacterium]
MAAANDTPIAKPPVTGLWGGILTATPIVLTVLATILAGLSNSEMTQAQYHRSLAAQYQSKVGDQWAFFQAKRIRGAGLETAAEHLPPVGPLDPARLKALAHRVTLAVDQIGKATHQPEDVAKRIAKEMSESESALNQELDKPAVAHAFSYLATAKLPEVEDHAVKDPALDEAIAAISERKSDDEINKLVAKVPDKLLVSAMDNAEKNAQAFDDAAKPIGKTIDQVGALVNHHTVLAETFLGDINSEQATTNANDAKEREAAAGAEVQVSRAVEKLHGSFAAARDRFNANRYRRDADYNQRIAYLHEVQVHKSSVSADRHRDRSMHFFFGMLGAQAGVAISSIALAAKLRSVLWSLAGILGLAALAFSCYVYLFY